MGMPFRFAEHNLVVEGESQDLIALAVCLKNQEGTLGDLRFQLEQAFGEEIAAAESAVVTPTLTDDEVFRIYDQKRSQYLREDILARAMDMEIYIPDEQLNTVIKCAERSIDHNEIHWDAYWESIEYAIEHVMKGGR